MEDITTQPREVSLGVYPPVTRIFTNPNAKVVSPISVFNNTNDTLRLDIVLKAFRASNANNGSVQYYTLKDTPLKDLTFLNTVQIQDKSEQIKQINLYPKEYKTLQITFPGPFKNGDYYFSVIFLHQGAEAKTQDSLVHIATGVAGNVLVTSGETKTNTVAITPEFQTRNIVLTGPEKFNLTLDNNSDNFISVSGNIYVYDLFGNKAGEIGLKPAILLGSASRIMTGVDTSSGKPEDIVWGEKFMLGYYTAKAVIRVNQTSTQTYETHFFAIPLFILLVGTILLFIVLSILYRTLKKLNFKEG